MSFLQNVLNFLDTQMETPTLYGWFHWASLAVILILSVYLGAFRKGDSPVQIRRTVLLTAVVVAVLEVYKQINYSFSYTDGIAYDYQWYAFPFQFCSTPMYVGLLAGLTKKGRIHDAACAYLATYAIFAGACVMFYPTTVFVGTVGINIQTVVCHGSMIWIGVYLLATGYVKVQHKTILKAIPVFAICVAIAAIGNEVAYRVGLLETESFNMFFISPYCEPHLPVYSLVQGVVKFPWCLMIYIIGFSLAAYLMLLAAVGIKKLTTRKTKIAA